MTAHYALHLAGWLFLGGMLVGSHLWLAAITLLNRRKH